MEYIIILVEVGITIQMKEKPAQYFIKRQFGHPYLIERFGCQQTVSLDLYALVQIYLG
jgi:hypothetical protein